MAKIFLTGTTGYVGGDVLYRLASSNGTKYAISALVRNASKVEKVSKSYPNVRLVQGELDDEKLIQAEARNSDIVLHLAATGHIGSSSAIQQALAESSTKKPKHWIQISGATLLAAQEIAQGKLGFPNQMTYDDVNDLQDVLSIITSNPKRAVDNLVIAQDPSKIRTALVVGPLIYGTGRGPGNTRSVQAPEIARVTLDRKEGFQLLDGQNSWSNVHVYDLSDLIVSLVDAAVEEKPGLWNKEGVYFPENGNLKFGELSAKIAAEAYKQGLIADGVVKKSLEAKEADAISSHASILWGTNAVLRSSRARKSLGWSPSQPSLITEIPGIVQHEASTKAGLKI